MIRTDTRPSPSRVAGRPQRELGDGRRATGVTTDSSDEPATDRVPGKPVLESGPGGQITREKTRSHPTLRQPPRKCQAYVVPRFRRQLKRGPEYIGMRMLDGLPTC